jgi:molybdopterin molybdotransferase
MPEILFLCPPLSITELVEVTTSVGRITAEDILAPHPLPEFPRSTVDGYAVRASDTFGASDSLPGYLSVIGEVPMGDASGFVLGPAQCALIHTGGMLPTGADAVVMLEFTQSTGRGGGGLEDGFEIEIFRAVAEGENAIRIGEDVPPTCSSSKRGLSSVRPKLAA